MKSVIMYLVYAITIAISIVLAYMVSLVFKQLRWFVFIIVCLFLSEIIYRFYKWLYAHIKK